MTSDDAAGTTTVPTDTEAFGLATDEVRAGADPVAQAQGLYDRLTEEERLWLLDGDLEFWKGMRSFVEDGYNVFPYVMGAVDRLGIPGLRFVDGPRGCVVGRSTAFPVSMARGATWDVELEERVGHAIGAEIREQGGNFFGGVCINLPRHPAWGRSQETYSDQPVLLGALGAALTRGVQHHAMACMKHYALNSMENARFTVDVTVDEATLHEVYLPHFKQVSDAGVAAVMSSYNSVNGEWGGQNPYTLTTVLREDWGFEGTVVTDFIWGMRDGAKALAAGLDVEAPFHQQRGAWLRDALDDGRATWADVERAGVRILATQLRHHAGRDADEPQGTVASAEHVDLAREAARRAVVLLKNDEASGAPALPLDAAALRRLAVVGRLADVANTGDHGSSDVRAPYVVTAVEGLRAALPEAEIVTADPQQGAPAAADAARGADAAVVVVGYTAADEGEFVDGSVATREDLLRLYPDPVDDAQRADRDAVMAAMGQGLSVVGSGTAGGDRRDLHLRPEDVETVRAVAAANPRTVVVVVSAGAVLMEEWVDDVPAVLLGWYAGMEGGHALADVLLGAHNPSGRLPYPIPASADHLPPLDIDATAITYDRWYGQRLLQRDGVEALFPLGHGLAYTTYEVTGMEVGVLDRAAGRGEVRVAVRNTGGRDGRHVVQVYGSRADGDRAGERELLGFAVADVPAGSSVTVPVALDLTPVGRWDERARAVTVAAGPVVLEASSHWGDTGAARAEADL
ncbi:glycoside hydrolase family 3 C-terminal domain-containing protein [Cellulosimicrobium cellulans]|uniref:beta-glucosidase n=1 Tax=Cellulosimicrobium cellulans TaxID=1710 RepID=UPI001963C629|nr:glycoside hydrolase family 3 C-terminal domain-containing protein [Cellulosimicrobium cellulans]MBN0040757.1 glycoside hydrolase family 3 C-terminal domain-containing protein [Cellulosimicrobium cellulans]